MLLYIVIYWGNPFGKRVPPDPFLKLLQIGFGCNCFLASRQFISARCQDYSHAPPWRLRPQDATAGPLLPNRRLGLVGICLNWFAGCVQTGYWDLQCGCAISTTDIVVVVVQSVQPALSVRLCNQYERFCCCDYIVSLAIISAQPNSRYICCYCSSDVSAAARPSSAALTLIFSIARIPIASPRARLPPLTRVARGAAMPKLTFIG